MWLSLKGYAFSSSGEQVAILAALIAVYRRHQCAAPWCPLPGRHRTADGQHGLCRRHHPDLPNHRLSLAEIHARHRAHKPKGDDS